MTEQQYPHRQVRSFVRRQGRMSGSQRTALVTLWEQYGLTVESGRLDFAHVFGREAKRILEIGFGMGQSLLAQAKQNPDQDYIGIEVHKPGIANLLMAISAEQLTNLRVFNVDANDVLEHCIADNSLAAIQVFFPDPWPKRRHHKRRLVQIDFVALLQRKLQVGGYLHLATDWEDYALHMLQVIGQVPGFVNRAGADQFSARPVERPLTKFELRGQRLGHQVWDLVVEKSAAKKSLAF